MNFFNKFKKFNTNIIPTEIIEDVGRRTEWRTPANYGWLNCKLNQKELDYVWECVNNRQNNINKILAGNISNSYELVDKDEWFFKNTLRSLIYLYQKEFGVKGYQDIVSPKSRPCVHHLSTWWVNYQKQHEFNPLHNHSGVYSFVIWLKIPTEYEEQNKNNNTNTPEKSSFSFVYTNILGEIKSERIPLSKKYEGLMVFFPSTFMHQVQPFYNCEEDRISVSGNIALLY